MTIKICRGTKPVVLYLPLFVDPLTDLLNSLHYCTTCTTLLTYELHVPSGKLPVYQSSFNAVVYECVQVLYLLCRLQYFNIHLLLALYQYKGRKVRGVHNSATVNTSAVHLKQITVLAKKYSPFKTASEFKLFLSIRDCEHANDCSLQTVVLHTLLLIFVYCFLRQTL